MVSFKLKSETKSIEKPVEDSNDSIVIHASDSNQDDDDDDEEEEDEKGTERLISSDSAMNATKLLEGYCIVFERETEYHQLEVVDLRDVGDKRWDLANLEEMRAMTNVYGIQNDNDKALSWVR